MRVSPAICRFSRSGQPAPRYYTDGDIKRCNGPAGDANKPRALQKMSVKAQQDDAYANKEILDNTLVFASSGAANALARLQLDDFAPCNDGEHHLPAILSHDLDGNGCPDAIVAFHTGPAPTSPPDQCPWDKPAFTAVQFRFFLDEKRPEKDSTCKGPVPVLKDTASGCVGTGARATGCQKPMTAPAPRKGAISYVGPRLAMTDIDEGTDPPHATCLETNAPPTSDCTRT